MVARIAGRAPARSGSADGGLKRRMLSTYGTPFCRMSKSSVPKVAKPIKSETSRRARKTPLFQRPRLGPPPRGMAGTTLIGERRSFVYLAVPAHEPDRDEVHREREDEERQPDGEDRLVLE